jgi:hypothetical protein
MGVDMDVLGGEAKLAGCKAGEAGSIGRHRPGRKGIRKRSFG